MLQIFERSLTEADHQQLDKYLKFPTEDKPRGCISVTAYYGSFWVIIPMCFGGFIGWILKIIFRVPEDIAYGIGLTVASLYSIYAFHQSKQGSIGENRGLLKWKARVERFREQGTIQVVEFDIQRCWALEWDEDTGAAFLFQATASDFVFIYPVACLTQESEELTTSKNLREHARIELIPSLNLVMSFKTSGELLNDHVPVTSVTDLENVPTFETQGGFTLLKAEDVSAFIQHFENR